MNKIIFDVFKTNKIDEILTALLKASISTKPSNDLLWIAVSDSLFELSSVQSCSLGFISQELCAPVNSEISVRECQLRIAKVDDIGVSLLNDLQRMLTSKRVRFDSVILSCPNLAAICLLSYQILNILKSLGSGKLIFSCYTKNNDVEPITPLNGNLFWSETTVRRIAHQAGFKRIRRADDLYNTESWRHEKKIIIGNDEEFKIFDPYYSQTAIGLNMRVFVCDSGV